MYTWGDVKSFQQNMTSRKRDQTMERERKAVNTGFWDLIL